MSENNYENQKKYASHWNPLNQVAFNMQKPYLKSSCAIYMQNEMENFKNKRCTLI